MKIVVRADAGREIGTGHVMRCLALAQAAKEKGIQVTFLSADNMKTLRERLKKEGMGVARLACRPGSGEDAAATVRFAREKKADVLVLDGYSFGASYQKVVSASGLRHLVLDDDGRQGHYGADFILNQNAGAHRKLYSRREAGTKLLLGTRYALLRKEFLTKRGKKNASSTAAKVLVTLGGSDPENVTIRVLRALESSSLERLCVIVAVGPGNPHAAKLKAFCRSSRFSMTVKMDPDMSLLMAWADVAVSAAGSTCWELAFMGVPSLLFVTGANQRGTAAVLDRNGAAIRVRARELTQKLEALLNSVRLRKKLAAAGKKLVDGRGARRVIECLAR